MRKESRSKNRVPTLKDIDMFGCSVEETLSSINERCKPKAARKKKKRRADFFKENNYNESLEEERMQLVE